ncbi:MAG: hypothetical protein H7A23_12415 [Leptospiraceae bacterium]|nr:hypothetical protein [Leptospiraceae bacterium]MCP5495352.1 hypothetical protein [Leptospiraceae bacterium]
MLKKSIVFIFLCVFSVFSSEISFNGKSFKDFSGLKKEGIRIVKKSSKDYRLELEKVSFLNSELFLDFENKNSSELKDKNGNYSILRSNYAVDIGDSLLGHRYASFSSKNSYIAIHTHKASLLSSNNITEDLYVSFFLMPGELEKDSKIISKVYTTQGKIYGLECNIVNNKLEVTFKNMFYYKEKTFTFSLKSSDKLKHGKWTHVVVYVQPSSGYSALYENGVEKDKFYGILSQENPVPLSLGFHKNDTTPLFIGKNFYGKLDNFLVSTGQPDFKKLKIPFNGVEYDDGLKTVNQNFGSIYSKVESTKHSNSVPISLKYKVKQPEGTHFEIWYRFSDTIFSAEDELPLWKHYKDDDSFLKNRFKYFQWKAIMRSDYQGKYSPSLSSVKLQYSETPPPNTPTGLKIVSGKIDEAEVCLEWNSNFEENVWNGGGYAIHYGVSPNRMVASLFFKLEGEKQRITGLEEGEPVRYHFKSLKQCVNNAMIMKNAEYLEDKIDKNLLMFKKGITYYFKISAYNNMYFDKNGNFNKSSMDQKSKLSKPVKHTFLNDPNGGY